MTTKKDPSDITETPPPVTAKPNVYQDGTQNCNNYHRPTVTMTPDRDRRNCNTGYMETVT